MKKVKVIQGDNTTELEKLVNTWASSLNVIDIQYQMSCTNHYCYYSAMIIYED